MFNWVLLIVALVVMAAMATAAVYILAYWSDPEEKWTNWFPRIVIIICLFFILMLPLLVPFDVTEKQYAGTDSTVMPYIWKASSYIDLILLVVLLPYSYFFAQGKDLGEKVSKYAIVPLFIVLAIAIVILLLCFAIWWVAGYSDVPVTVWQPPLYYSAEGVPGVLCTYTTDPSIALSALDTAVSSLASAGGPESFDSILSIRTGFLTYTIGICSFLGSIFFIVFLSIGIFILPIDFILAFVRRPHSMNKKELQEFKAEYASRSASLLEIIDDIYSKIVKEFGPDKTVELLTRNDRKAIFSPLSLKKERKKFEVVERAVEELDKQYTEIIQMNMKETANPLKYYALLFVGIFLLLVSILWYVQVVLAQASVYYVVDQAFVAMNSTGIPFFSLIFYGLFTLYLTFCFLKGVTKFGFRFIFFISIHPMERNNTPLPSFVFNTILMLLCALPSLQFCSLMIKTFSVGSSMDILFGSTVTMLRGIKYWFMYYIWVFVGLAPLAVLIWLCIPHKTLEEKMREQSRKTLSTADAVINKRKKELSKQERKEAKANKTKKGKSSQSEVGLEGPEGEAGGIPASVL